MKNNSTHEVMLYNVYVKLRVQVYKTVGYNAR